MRAALAALALIATPAAAQTVPAPLGEIEARVYFELGSTTPAAEFRPAIDALIAKLKARPWRRISVEGHSDTDPSPGEAFDRSNRMAWNVRDLLVAESIDPSRIAIFAYGRGKPLVETPDGVREPLNRRVEVRVEWE